MMSSGKMVRKQLYLPEHLNESLKEFSVKYVISESDVVRRALSRFMEQEGRKNTPPGENPVLKMKGLFEYPEGANQAGQNLDDIVYGDPDRYGNDE